MDNLFQKATKEAAKLRLAISGPSGSGKTYTSLLIAQELGSKIAYIDTEHGSASKYADLFTFDVINMSSPYHPDTFGQYIQMAEKHGYDVVIIDSLSHAWNGTGGLLEIVDKEAEKLKRNGNFNKMAAWKEATPIHNRLIENIISCGIHIIATMRSKQEYIIEKNEKGKTVINKMGLAPIQRDGMEYEFDVWMEMTIENKGVISKSRCPELAGEVFKHPGKEVANTLVQWLDGAEPAPKPEKKPERIYNDKERAEYHAIGNALYPDSWKDKRSELVKAISKGRAESTTELTRDEFIKLLENLRYKQEQNQPPPPSNGDLSERLYGNGEQVTA